MNETCRVCGEEKERIEEHHVNPLSDKTIKLCSQCHNTVHWKRDPRGSAYFKGVKNKGLLLKLWNQIDSGEQRIESRCKSCGYEWEYSGYKVEGQSTCCPRCMKQTKIGGGL